jgi:hypothetical protein
MNESIALVLSVCTKLCKGDARVRDFSPQMASRQAFLFVSLTDTHENSTLPGRSRVRTPLQRK